MSDAAGRGLPLLSGPPPRMENGTDETNACRKCNKEFNVIFARSRRCNHCGYSYCQSCTDYQAMMPRTGPETGYDPMNVCSFCIEFLQITAAGRHQLKAMPLQKLKKYMSAYNIKTERIVEKDDLIDAIIDARQSNGCLPRANESYYRKYSIPNKAVPRRGLFSRQTATAQSSNAQTPPTLPRETRPEFARPDLAPDNPPPPPPPRPNNMPFPQQPRQAPQPQAYPHPPYGYAHPPQPQQQYHPSQPSGYGYPGYAAHNHQGPPPAPQHSRPPPTQPPQNNFYHPQSHYGPPPSAYPPRPQQTPPQNYQTRPTPPPRPATAHPPTPPAAPRPRTVSTTPPPTLDQLLNMTQAAISSLSVSALKEILFLNHVNAGRILEKSELVKKVLTLIADEKADRERQRRVEEIEEMERIQRQTELRERERRASAERERETPQSNSEGRHEPSSSEAGNDAYEDEKDGEDHPMPSSSPPKPKVETPKATGSASTLERTGLCVICQDEEANIAIVDCGHMAMCRGCSDLVMSSSRECPLCRTRIVTEARLLRIFKT